MIKEFQKSITSLLDLARRKKKIPITFFPPLYFFIAKDSVDERAAGNVFKYPYTKYQLIDARNSTSLVSTRSEDDCETTTTSMSGKFLAPKVL